MDNETICKQFKDSVTDKNYVVIFLYVPVALMALFANLMVIVVVIKFQYMRNVTNYFLVNLSVADLFVTVVCMPTSALSAYTRLWPFDLITCKLGNYLQCISVASSVFTITAMAVDRYLAIARPFGFCRWFTRKSTIIIIAVMWIASIIIFFPLIIVTAIHVERFEKHGCQMEFCLEKWDSIEKFLPRYIFGTISFAIMFAIPGLIILGAYSMMGKRLCSVRPPFDDNNSISTQQSYRLVRERKRVAWILLMLVLVFAVCWLPYNMMNLLIDYELIDAPVDMGPYLQYMLLLGHANSALNPIIYCVMSKNFRKSVKQILCGTRINFETRKNQRLQVKFPETKSRTTGITRFLSSVRSRMSYKKWADSSGSSQRLCLQRINAEPPKHFPINMTLSRLQSSQKTTKTCAV